MTLGAEIRKFEPIIKIAAGSLPIRMGYFDFDHQVGMALDRGKGNRKAWRLSQGRIPTPRQTFPGAMLERLGVLKPRTRSVTVDEIKLEILWKLRALKETEAGQNASWDEPWK